MTADGGLFATNGARGGADEALKRYTVGTHRICPPNDTLARVQPLLADMGITRIANVTGLDRIGIPVVMVSYLSAVIPTILAVYAQSKVEKGLNRVIPETFRNWPGTLRSEHPLESVCARGPRAEEVTRDHPIAFSDGPGSPFDLDSRILLLGVGFNRCTALHFAESLVARRRTMTVRFLRHEGARRKWIEVPNVADDLDTHFPVIGAQYLSARRATEGTAGEAKALCFRMRDLVDFAREYFERVL